MKNPIVTIKGTLFWPRWMHEFNTKFNETNDKYECAVGELSEEDVAKLAGIGVKVKNKEGPGNYYVSKSKFAFTPVDEDGKPVDVNTLGQGSKVVAAVSSYSHRMSAKYGNGVSTVKLVVTDLVKYTPSKEDDDSDVL